MWCDWCGRDQPNKHDQLECWRRYHAEVIRALDNTPTAPIPLSMQTTAQLEVSVLELWYAMPNDRGQ